MVGRLVSAGRHPPCPVRMASLGCRDCRRLNALPVSLFFDAVRSRSWIHPSELNELLCEAPSLNPVTDSECCHSLHRGRHGVWFSPVAVLGCGVQVVGSESGGCQLRSGAKMSVEASELSTEVWTRWQGHVINRVYPLGRYLGCSDHSGVFLTRSAEHGSSEVAIKLVPADRALAELQLPRWKKAGNLAHRHLLRMLEWGGCQLEGSPYLYVVMEYADQTLAQLLLHRALTADEAREMLLPTLDALEFLHARGLVHGALKPANIMVVGDQLKLASDTIRRVDAGKTSSPAISDFSPHGQDSAAADVRALGLTLFEALTRRPSSTLGNSREGATLPADFSQTFRDVVTRCLSPKPQDRPGVTELRAWADPQTAANAAASHQLAAPASSAPRTAEPAPLVLPQVEPAAPQVAPAAAGLPKSRTLLATMLAVAVIFTLVWMGVRLIRSHQAPVTPAATFQSPEESPSQTASAALPTTPTQAGRPVPRPSSASPAPSGAGTSSSPTHQEDPDVSPSARRSIHGHIKVWVRVTVDQAGAVSAAVVDRAGPSRYFERISLEAAKKWTFPPLDSHSGRLMQVRFDFSRDGTTAHAVALH